MIGGVLVVGERINATRARIGAALASRDVKLIAREARAQAEAGADYIDVNAGRAGGSEPEELAWLVECVQAATDRPLCLDSADPAALGRALGLTREKPIINSVNGDRARMDGVLPLAAASGAGLVALTMEEGRMPESVADRVRVAEKLARAAASAGIPLSRVYFDPCVLAAATSPDQPRIVLETVREIRRAWPDSHVICGLSNVSFGLPLRGLLNRTYLAMMVAYGADALIIDPTDPGIRSALAAAGVLAGRDEYGMEYIAAVREGRLSDGGARPAGIGGGKG